jgi:hypothetical protein
MMLVCGNAISQKDTSKKNDSLRFVCIDTSIARKVANDLVNGDVCKAEIKIVRENFKLLKEKVSLKDSIIFNKDKQILNLESIIFNKDEQRDIFKEQLKQREAELKSEKRKTVFYKLTTLATLVLSVVLVVN